MQGRFRIMHLSLIYTTKFMNLLILKVLLILCEKMNGKMRLSLNYLLIDQKRMLRAHFRRCLAFHGTIIQWRTCCTVQG